MADITVSEDRFARYSVDEYATVSVQVITRLTMPDGKAMDSSWRMVIDPDTTLADVKLEGLDPVPKALKDAVVAARYPAAVARFAARKAESESIEAEAT